MGLIIYFPVVSPRLMITQCSFQKDLILGLTEAQKQALKKSRYKQLESSLKAFINFFAFSAVLVIELLFGYIYLVQSKLRPTNAIHVKIEETIENVTALCQVNSPSLDSSALIFESLLLALAVITFFSFVRIFLETRKF